VAAAPGGWGIVVSGAVIIECTLLIIIARHDVHSPLYGWPGCCVADISNKRVFPVSLKRTD